MPDNRRLVVTENISANGVIEFIDDWFDPADQGDAEDLFTMMGAQMAREEALLLGRKTFEEFRGYWPLQTDDVSGSAAHLNRVPKYVVSSTMTDAAWSTALCCQVGSKTRSRPLKLRRWRGPGCDRQHQRGPRAHAR